MINWIRINNHPRGLVYIGRSFSINKKIEPVTKVQPVKNNLEEAKFQYYYYLYIKKGEMRHEFDERI